jgi:hypothetical protein
VIGPPNTNCNCSVCGTPLYRAPYDFLRRKSFLCRDHIGRALILAAEARFRSSDISEKRKADAVAAKVRQEAKRAEIAGRHGNAPPWRKILMEVADKYEITVAELVAPGRGPAYHGYRKRGSKVTMFTIRMEAACRLRAELGLSLHRIGHLLGRDHTCILRMVSKERRAKHMETTAAGVVNRVLGAPASGEARLLELMKRDSVIARRAQASMRGTE